VSFGVPQEDVSDADVATAVNDLISSAESPAISRLSDEIATETARAMRKLEAFRQAEGRLPEGAIFDLIAHAATRIDRTRNDLFDNPWRSAVLGGAACLRSMDTEQAVDAITRLESTEALVKYVAEVVRYLKTRDADAAGERLPAAFDVSAVCGAASTVIHASLEANTAGRPLEDGAMANFWAWRYLDPEAAKAWLVKQVDTERWTMAETMGAFTTTSVPVGVPNPVPTIENFQLSAVNEIFGIDRVLAELSSELGAATPPGGDTVEIPATPENRVKYALFRLKQQRDKLTNTDEMPADAIIE